MTPGFLVRRCDFVRSLAHRRWHPRQGLLLEKYLLPFFSTKSSNYLSLEKACHKDRTTSNRCRLAAHHLKKPLPNERYSCSLSESFPHRHYLLPDKLFLLHTAQVLFPIACRYRLDGHPSFCIPVALEYKQPNHGYGSCQTLYHHDCMLKKAGARICHL